RPEAFGREDRKSGCGGETRSRDLLVMSQAGCRCPTPLKSLGDAHLFRSLHDDRTSRMVFAIRNGVSNLRGSAVKIGPQNVPRDARQTLEFEHAAGRDLFPRIKSLVPDAQPIGKLPQPTNNFSAFLYEVDHDYQW